MVEILREAGIACRIRVDDYEVDEIDDLAELAGRGVYRIREFVISDGANRVGFFINGRRAILAVRDPDLALRGATAEVQRIAQRCRRHFPRSAIDTRARAEAPTFWQRSKDDVWIAAVSGVIFLVVGYLLGRLG